MLRILSVCRTLPTPERPGAGIFVFNRLKAMSSRADLRILQPIAYFPGLAPVPRWAADKSHAVQGLDILHEPMFYIPSLLKLLDGHWLSRAVIRKLRELQRCGPIDLLDAHFGYPDGVGCVMAARRLGIPVFVTIRGLEAVKIQQPALRRQIIDALNSATGCISVSHSLRDVMVAAGVRANNIAVIPNAIDSTLFRPGDKAAMRAKLGLSAHDRLIVSVGHLISGKRHNVLLRALARLGTNAKPVSLAIVGGADYEPQCPDALKALTKELNLTPRVRFLGGVPPERVAEWLQAADVFALATAREGCCNAVLESLSSGTPVVTTPVGDNAYYVSDGINGYLVPVDDVDAMAAGLTKALSRSWDANAISRGLAIGTWGDVADKVLNLFAERLMAAKSNQGAI